MSDAPGRFETRIRNDPYEFAHHPVFHRRVYIITDVDHLASGSQERVYELAFFLGAYLVQVAFRDPAEINVGIDMDKRPVPDRALFPGAVGRIVVFHHDDITGYLHFE